MAVTVQDILQTSFAPYAATHKVPRRVWRAARAVMSCRTAALGGHVRRCPLVPASGVSALLYPPDQSVARRLATAGAAHRPLSRHLHPAQ